MADTPRTNIDGYNRVIEAIKAIIDNPEVSPQTWLAERLDITRQAAHHWRIADGIPAKHVTAVSKITGLSAHEIRPEDIAAQIPGSVFDEISRQATARKTTFPARLLAVIKAGLHINP